MIRKLSLSLLVLVASGQVLGMQQQLQRPPLTPMQVIGGALVAGLTVEGIYLIAQGERYKHIVKFAVDHPGLAIAGTGSVIGAGMLFKQPIRNLILGLADLVK